jgi:hypothetical protein
LTGVLYGMQQFMAGIDAVFFGRKSHEMLLVYDPNPYPEKQKYVIPSRI